MLTKLFSSAATSHLRGQQHTEASPDDRGRSCCQRGHWQDWPVGKQVESGRVPARVLTAQGSALLFVHFFWLDFFQADAPFLVQFLPTFSKVTAQFPTWQMVATVFPAVQGWAPSSFL